jgi:molybdate transport system regulatory protein
LDASHNKLDNVNMNALRARFKLWLSTKGVEGVFGDGKWRLLKAVDETGSLSAASELLRISYRKAWGDLKKAQDNLNVTLVEKQRGGKAGGKTVLTDEGRKLIMAYTKFRADIEKQIEKAYDKYIRECLR